MAKFCGQTWKQTGLAMRVREKQEDGGEERSILSDFLKDF